MTNTMRQAIIHDVKKLREDIGGWSSDAPPNLNALLVLLIDAIYDLTLAIEETKSA